MSLTLEEMEEIRRAGERLGDRIAGEIGALRSDAQSRRYDATNTSATINNWPLLPQAREVYAGLAMNALLRADSIINPDVCADLAVQHAEALIRALHRRRG